MELAEAGLQKSVVPSLPCAYIACQVAGYRYMGPMLSLVRHACTNIRTLEGSGLFGQQGPVSFALPQLSNQFTKGYDPMHAEIICSTGAAVIIVETKVMQSKRWLNGRSLNQSYLQLF